MKASEQIGAVGLGLWLILTGLFTVLHIHNHNMDVLTAVIALAAGILFLMSRSHLKGRIGTLFLGIWLISAGARPVVMVHIPFFTLISGVVAIVAGVLILIDQ